MSKRRPPAEDSSRPPKRPRPDHHLAPPAIEEIHSARQLQGLLAFSGGQEGEVQRLRKGIASCKALLETVLYRKDPDDWGRRVGILTEWLDSQKPPLAERKDAEGGREQRPFLPDLWQALSFSLSAGQNDQLTSAILSLLALVMKTLAALLEFRSHGLLLARSVLRSPQLALVRKCLETPKHKEFLISPGVRLLSEVVGFDGGLLVREVWKRREEGSVAWRWVGRGLGMVKNEYVSFFPFSSDFVEVAFLPLACAHLLCFPLPFHVQLQLDKPPLRA